MALTLRTAKSMPYLWACVVALLAQTAQADEATLAALLPSLQQGGYVIVLRHGPTDGTQQDVYPLDYADMTRQRQLSESGKDVARRIGAALASLDIPIGTVFTSHLNRAMETGRLVSRKDVSWNDGLNDSGLGSASAMAGASTRGNPRYAMVLQQLTATRPQFRTNTLIVTHKTNIEDAFGRRFADVREGESLLFRPDDAGRLAPVARVEASAWTALARGR